MEMPRPMSRSADDADAPDTSVPRERFDLLYKDSGDPWGLGSAWYERRKHAITVAALPRERYRSGLEPGCSTGELTRLLAVRCGRLLAFDFAEAAVKSARQSVSGMPHVSVERHALPAGLPPGGFDLIVASEVLYYLSAPDLESPLDGMAARIDPGGDLVAVHHRARDRCYGYDGHNVHAALEARPEFCELARYDDDDFALRVLRKAPAAHGAPA
jgi:SAM-dependent methyltransferase